MTGLDDALSKEVEALLSTHFERNILITSVVQLSEPGRRNLILRLYTDNVPQSLIFKQTLHEKSSEDDQEAFDRFARDWAGLEFLSQVKPKELLVPRFYGGSIKHRFVLLEDLGESHVSLVDSLTGEDEVWAKEALHRFVKCLAHFHGAGYGKTGTYYEILKRLNPEVMFWENDLKIILEESLPKLESLFKVFDISQSEGLWTEIKRTLKAPLEPGPFTTFIHGDNCPDNVFDDPAKNELHLIDFEWGSVKSALLDGTYLRMSMPTCWCSKAVPEDLITALETIYREELMKGIPAAREDEAYQTAYTDACGFWMLNSLTQIDKVMDKDVPYNNGPVPENSLWKPEENSGRPRTLSRLQAFIDVSKKYDRLPHLRAVAAQILKELKIRWPNAKPLDVYSAFQERSVQHNTTD